MLLSKGAIEAVQEAGLKPVDFYRESHGLIYDTACNMDSAGEPVDALTIRDELERRSILDKVGGVPRIHELAALAPATSNAPHYARIVKETASLRRLIRAGAEISRLGQERPGDLADLMILAEAALSSAVSATVTSQFGSVADGLTELVAEIQEAIDTGQVKYGLRTGFPDLDNKLTGFHPGQLILIAARPAMGKSALALNIAENVADLKIPASVLSLEMVKSELQIRGLARAAKLDSKKIRTGRILADELDSFRQGVAVVESRRDHLFIEDNPATSIQALRAEARRLQRTQGLGLIAVDYIQLMTSGGSEENRQQEISSISRSLKLMARELNVPVLALSQLNRNLEMRADKRPMLSDLRESGSLEQDADVVLFVYRDDYYNPESMDAGMAEIIVAKNRQGENGTIKLGYVGKHTEFRSLGSGLRSFGEDKA
jgi:replicative DNA helicase